LTAVQKLKREEQQRGRSGRLLKKIKACLKYSKMTSNLIILFIVFAVDNKPVRSD